MGKNKKTRSKKEQLLEDAIGQRWIYVISSSCIAIIGVWMLLDPSDRARNSVERVSSAFVKEIWGETAGIIFLILAIPLISWFIYKISVMRKLIFIKLREDVFTIFEHKKNLESMNCLYDLDDIVFFDKNEKRVIRLNNYKKTKVGKYRKAEIAKGISFEKAYWYADEKGHLLIENGIYLSNGNERIVGNDKIISFPELHKKFKLANYQNSKNKKMHAAIPL